MTRFLIAILLGSAALAQTPAGRMEGPVLGLTPDTDQLAARPLLGVPGAATFGDPLGHTVGLRILAAQNDLAIGVDGSGAAALATASDRRSLPGAAGVSKAALSPRGSAAALYRDGAADIIVGLPDAARLLRTIPVDSVPAGLAVSDDGAALALLMRPPRGAETIVWVQADAAPQTIYRARRIASIAFLPGASTAIVAERGAVKLLSPAIGAQTIADGISDVIAAAASADGSRLVIATAPGKIAVQDLASSARVWLSCPCGASGLERLRGNAVFLLNRPGDGPLWMLDADSSEPRVTFVAAAAGGLQ